MSLTNFPEFFALAGKRVLITGHTGFTGSWAAIWLSKMGADVIGYALAPESSPNLFVKSGIEKQIQSFKGDVRDLEKLKKVVQETRPELVLHLAAQPLVRRSYRMPAETFEVNTQGTVNVLQAAFESDSVRGTLCITTDKVYRNNNSGTPFTEEDELGGADPYSGSKAAAEVAINSFRESFLGTSDSGRSLVSARGGNIIGGGDWSDDRLVPDFVKAWQTKSSLSIRFPEATRPWQHVLGLVDGYLKILSFMASGHSSRLSSAYNFGPLDDETLSVAQVVGLMSQVLPGVSVNRTYSKLKEAQHLQLDSSRAVQELDWKIPWGTNESIRRTLDWYQRFYEGEPADLLCLEQVNSWEEAKLFRNGTD